MVTTRSGRGSTPVSKSPRAKRGASHSQEDPWHATTTEVLKAHGIRSLEEGLKDDEYARLFELHGPNELPEEEGRSFLDLVLEQFDDPLVKILLVAAVISAAIAVSETYEEGEKLTIDKFVEPLVILLILFLNAVVGVWQEASAEKSLEALKEMQPDEAIVIRHGQRSTVPARTLVPGDVIDIRVGDRVPADCRLIELSTTTLRVEQMILTGESVTISKTIDAVDRSDDNPEIEIQSKHNMLFSGTTVSNGHGTCVVSHTGMKTEIGKIQAQIKEAADATAEEKTPLKQKLDEFSDQLQWIIGIICVLVWLINFQLFVFYENFEGTVVPNPTTIWIDYKKAIYYFQIAVALAVAAIPEGLPTVITMCLALGTRKMARRNCIVRQLPAVETLGCTTVICSDKTGTLTTNQMSVKGVVVSGASASTKLKIEEVTGSTYDPSDGEFVSHDRSHNLNQLAEIAALCNSSSVVIDDNGKHVHIGAPTEASLKVLVEKMAQGSVTSSEDAVLPFCRAYEEQAEKIATLEFTRDRKSMSVIVTSPHTDSNRLLVKGAPESVLDRCTHLMLKDGKRVAMSAAAKKAALAKVNEMASNAWRCLGFAVKTDDLGQLSNYDGPSHPAHALLADPLTYADFESGLTWVGSVGMQDPPRANVADAIANCGHAGIRVMVITGDNKLTAEAISKEIGVLRDDDDLSKTSFMGYEFMKLSEKEQRKILFEGARGGLVFSRAEPKFKQYIVGMLKKGNEIVAMTGDGVNDAPALKMADIGIAMGITGTEVAKQASDLVLADDEFSTIVAAVEEGRSIYSNTKAYVRYMISSNIGEVASIFLVAALGLPEGLVPVQLLFVNLVTDGPPATALGFNKPEPDVMSKPPRSTSEKLVDGWTLFRYCVVGAYVGMATVGIFGVWYTQTSFLGIDLSQDGHTPVTYEMLSHWDRCDLNTNEFALPSGTIKNFRANSFTANGPYGIAESTVEVSGCDYFREGKIKASTLSLSVLVVIEMLNALNALTEDGSLLEVGPTSNPWLLLAMATSFASHAAILYIPKLSPYFDVSALDTNEVLLVFAFSVPVLFLDEILKFVGRRMSAAARERRAAADAAKRAAAKKAA